MDVGQLLFFIRGTSEQMLFFGLWSPGTVPGFGDRLPDRLFWKLVLCAAVASSQSIDSKRNGRKPETA
jgi:hypothetical protein